MRQLVRRRCSLEHSKSPPIPHLPFPLPFWGSVQLQLPLALPLLLLLTHNNVALYSGAVVFHDSGLHKGVGCYEWKRKRQLTIGSHRSSQSTVSVPGTTFVEERCEVWEYGSRVVSGRDDVSPDRLLASVERFLQKKARRFKYTWSVKRHRAGGHTRSVLAPPGVFELYSRVSCLWLRF